MMMMMMMMTMMIMMFFLDTKGPLTRLAPWRGGEAINHDDDDDSDNDDDNNGDDNDDAFSKTLFCRIILVDALSG